MLEEQVDSVRSTAKQWRVSPIDFDDIGAWLVERLQARHPNASQQAIMGWLRGCMFANSIWFVRTRDAVALAEIVRVPLEEQPIVIEHFVLSREEAVDEAADLYPAMASWAANQNASALHWDRYSDVSRIQFKNRCGGFQTKSFPYMRLGVLE